MKVRLVTDAPMPNIALMKIHKYYKSMGVDVGWHNPLFDNDTDMLYISHLFNFTQDYPYAKAGTIIKGGTGHDITKHLDPDIEKIRDIDYDLYPDCNYSMQFFSRGCIRNCPFCVVRQKEGYIHPVEPMEFNPAGEWVEVLDNSFFANPEWRSAADTLLRLGQPVKLHGIDARILTEENAVFLNKIKHKSSIYIAWDNPRDNMEHVLRKISTWVKPYKFTVYVLIGYWSTPEEDLHRIKILREIKMNPFVMPFNKTDRYQMKFARWVNRKEIFKSCTWEEYNRTNV